MWTAAKLGYRGNTNYDRAYLGDELVWEKLQKIPDDEIWYTSKDGKIILPYVNNFGPYTNIVSNTYTDGKGIIKFDNVVSKFGWECFAMMHLTRTQYLTSIIIPNKVTLIDNLAFDNLYWYNITSYLDSVTIGENVTTIGREAFNGNRNLTNINIISDKLTTIDREAFSLCDKLPKIVLPNSLTSIGDGAFSNCSSLSNIQYTGTKSQWGFISKGWDWKAYVPATVVHCIDGDVNI